jgi:hypothetical protein
MTAPQRQPINHINVGGSSPGGASGYWQLSHHCLTLTYSNSAFTQSARLEGRVQGVVVHAHSWAPSVCRGSRDRFLRTEHRSHRVSGRQEGDARVGAAGAELLQHTAAHPWPPAVARLPSSSVIA